jgi:hypothetical protein
MLTRRQKQIRWTFGKLTAAVIVSAFVLLPKDFELPAMPNFNPFVTEAFAAGD